MPHPRSKNRLPSIKIVRRLNLHNRSGLNHSIRRNIKHVVRLVECRNPRLGGTVMYPPADVNAVLPEIKVNPILMIHNSHVIMSPDRIIHDDIRTPSLPSASVPLRRSNIPVRVNVENMKINVNTMIPVLNIKESMPGGVIKRRSIHSLNSRENSSPIPRIKTHTLLPDNDHIVLQRTRLAHGAGRLPIDRIRISGVGHILRSPPTRKITSSLLPPPNHVLRTLTVIGEDSGNIKPVSRSLPIPSQTHIPIIIRRCRIENLIQVLPSPPSRTRLITLSNPDILTIRIHNRSQNIVPRHPHREVR